MTSSEVANTLINQTQQTVRKQTSSADHTQHNSFKITYGPGPIYHSSGYGQTLRPVYSQHPGEVLANDRYFKKGKHNNICLSELGRRPVFLYNVHAFSLCFTFINTFKR